MVVSFDPPAEYAGLAVGGPRGKGLAVVLSPVWAVSRRVKDVRGALVNPAPDSEERGDDALGPGGKGERDRGDEAYLCALVMPGLLPGSYGIGLWRQVVVQVSRMEEEVLMEWDEATRYYYLTV
jgi:kinesin family protein 2/24